MIYLSSLFFSYMKVTMMLEKPCSAWWRNLCQNWLRSVGPKMKW